MKTKELLYVCAAAAALTGCTNTKIQYVAKNGQTSFDYSVLNLMEFPYQSFVKNWDDDRQPVLCADIMTVEEFDDVFGAAATMDNKKPFTPSEDDLSKYQYVVISKVTIPAVKGSSFKVDSVDYKENHLTVQYTYTKPTKDAGYDVKDGFVLRLPRVQIDTITVYENAQIVAEVNTAYAKISFADRSGDGRQSSAQKAGMSFGLLFTKKQFYSFKELIDEQNKSACSCV